MFEEEDDGSITFSHHPSTTPQDVEVMASEPEKALSKAYDAVLNGVELGSIDAGKLARVPKRRRRAA